MPDTPELYLVFRVGRQMCALPLEHVEETMRPLPVRPVPAAPPFVSGVAVVRGGSVPVVHAGSVLGSDDPSSHAGRFVALKVAGRRVALAVDDVLGVRSIDRAGVSRLPPLLARAGESVVSALATLDAELLMILRSASFVPEAVWTAVEAGERP